MRRKYQVICIDDDEQFIRSLSGSVPGKVAPLCEDFDCCFEFVTSVQELQAVISSPDTPELAMLVSDQTMVGITGVDLIERVKGQYPNVMCVLLTGHVAPDSVKYAVNRRLLDQYVSKPIEDADLFASMLANLLKQYHANREENERTEQLARVVTELRRSNDNISKMLAMAKNIATLAKDLRSLEYDEVVKLGVKGAARIFNAKNCVFCTECGGRGDAKTCRRENCEQGSGAGRDVIILPDEALTVCRRLDGKELKFVIPLCSADSAKQDGPSVHGHLCMYGVDPGVISSPESLQYTSSLIRDILAASLANAKLYERVKNESEMDYLTETRSRRVFDAMLEAEYKRSLRYDHAFCVMILDVDRFKTINDQHGHSAGDQILCGLAEVLRGELRETDVLARYGGDEFVILMPQTKLDGAMDLADRMRRTVGSRLSIAGQTITISCGVAEWTGLRDETIAEVLRRADAALYQAKRGGRNRVETVRAA